MLNNYDARSNGKRLDNGLKCIFSINIHFSFVSRFCILGMSLKGDKHNVALLLTLVILSSTFECSLGTDQSSHDLRNGDEHSLLSNGENISAKMLHIRHLLKSLFSDLNFGESELKGNENFFLFLHQLQWSII